VTRRLRPSWLVCAGVWSTVACSRADLDAITRAPDGGADDAPSVVCPSTVLLPGDSMQTVEIGSVTRNYLLHVPSAYDGSKPVPLVLDFHALTTSGMQQRNASTFPAVTDPEGVVMAFPTGLPGPSGNAWDVGPCCVANVDDVAFAKAVAKQVGATACIDPKRVYATGFSMGGGMAHYLACHAADVFAAVAPGSFDLLQDNVAECQPPRPVTEISFRGSADMVVPYAGGYSAVVPGMPVTFLGAEGTFQKWADIDHCTGSPSTPDGNGCSTRSGCAGGVEVVLCTKQGGGQAEPDATIAWPVLKRHTLP
jgi:polyhydroxybutyrate depolymerase